MRRSISTLSIILSLISFPCLAQTGFDDRDTTQWIKIDTVEFKSNSTFLAYYGASSIQKIRVDRIGNSSWTAVFYVDKNLLINAVVAHHEPYGNERLYIEKYSFTNGTMTSWKACNEQVKKESKNYETEETRILGMFNDYFEEAQKHNSKKR